MRTMGRLLCLLLQQTNSCFHGEAHYAAFPRWDYIVHRKLSSGPRTYKSRETQTVGLVHRSVTHANAEVRRQRPWSCIPSTTRLVVIASRRPEQVEKIRHVSTRGELLICI